MEQEGGRIRSIAGYLLKNNSRLILSAPVEVADYVKAAVLQAFNDSSIMVRNAASQDIVAFLGILEPKNWPECLEGLVNALDSTDLDKQEVSIIQLMKILRDTQFVWIPANSRGVGRIAAPITLRDFFRRSMRYLTISSQTHLIGILSVY